MHGTKHGLDLGVDRKQQAKIKELPGEKKKNIWKKSTIGTVTMTGAAALTQVITNDGQDISGENNNDDISLIIEQLSAVNNRL